MALSAYRYIKAALRTYVRASEQEKATSDEGPRVGVAKEQLGNLIGPLRHRGRCSVNQVGPSCSRAAKGRSRLGMQSSVQSVKLRRSYLLVSSK